MGFAGLRVLSLESRRAAEMETLLRKQGAREHEAGLRVVVPVCCRTFDRSFGGGMLPVVGQRGGQAEPRRAVGRYGSRYLLKGRNGTLMIAGRKQRLRAQQQQSRRGFAPADESIDQIERIMAPISG